MNGYKEESTILWHNVDLRQEIKPYAFLNLMQEIAGNHANKLHFGYNDLKECEQTWVLSRIKVRYNSWPKWQERVTLETWHKGMQSLFGLRDFILHSAEGSPDAGAQDAEALAEGASNEGSPNAGAQDAEALAEGSPDAGASNAGAPAVRASAVGAQAVGASDAGASDAGASTEGAQATGAPAVVATSSWLIMNSRTRRIERANNFYNNPEILNQANSKNAIDEPCDRLKFPGDMELVSEHIVKYSDLDALGHTNNAKYSEWTTDSIDPEIFQNYRVKEFQINFNAETKLGEHIEIWSKEIETPEEIRSANAIAIGAGSRTFCFEGRRDGKSVYEAIFTFIPYL